MSQFSINSQCPVSNMIKIELKLVHHWKVPPHIVPSDIRVSGKETNIKHISLVFEII